MIRNYYLDNVLNKKIFTENIELSKYDFFYLND